jgi:hypothetical protein
VTDTKRSAAGTADPENIGLVNDGSHSSTTTTRTQYNPSLLRPTRAQARIPAEQEALL